MTLMRIAISAVFLATAFLLTLLLWTPTTYKPVYPGIRGTSCSRFFSSNPYSVRMALYREAPYEWLADLKVSGPDPGRKGTYIVVEVRTANENDVRFGTEIEVSKHFGLTKQSIKLVPPTVTMGFYYKHLVFTVSLAERALTSIKVELPEITIDGELFEFEPLVVRPVRVFGC